MFDLHNQSAYEDQTDRFWGYPYKRITLGLLGGLRDVRNGVPTGRLDWLYWSAYFTYRFLAAFSPKCFRSATFGTQTGVEGKTEYITGAAKRRGRTPAAHETNPVGEPWIIDPVVFLQMWNLYVPKLRMIGARAQSTEAVNASNNLVLSLRWAVQRTNTNNQASLATLV